MKYVSLMSLALTLTVASSALAQNKMAKPADISKVAKVAALTLDTSSSVIGWVGKKPTGSSHNGTIALKEGSLKLDGLKPTEGSFVIDMTTIKNLDLKDAGYNKKLVDHLTSDEFFNVSKFPTASFKITKADPIKGGNMNVTGDLTIKGITKSITFPAEVMQHGKMFHATGKLKFNRADFDVRYNSGRFFDPKKLGDKLINDEIEIEIDLKTVPVGA